MLFFIRKIVKFPKFNNLENFIIGKIIKYFEWPSNLKKNLEIK